MKPDKKIADSEIDFLISSPSMDSDYRRLVPD